MIIGELTVGVRIQLEKHRQDTLFLKIDNSQKIYRRSYIIRSRSQPKGEAEMGHEGPTPPHGVGHTMAAPGHGVAALAYL